MSRPVLTGCYADLGEAFTEEGRRLGEVSLSGLLFGDPASASAGGRLVAIEDGPETIDLRIVEPGEPAATHRFSRYTWLKAWRWDRRIQGEPFYPVKGFVEIDRGAEQGGAAWLGLYVVGRSCLVRKAVDGSLLVLQDVNAAGVAVVVPFAARRTIWCRFPARPHGCPATAGGEGAARP